MSEAGNDAETWALQLAEQGHVDFGLKLWKLIPDFVIGAAVAAVSLIVFRAVDGEGDLGAFAFAIGVAGLLCPVVFLPPLWPGTAPQLLFSGKEIAIVETMRWTTIDKLDISAELRTSILDWDRRTDQNADSEAPMDMRVQAWESRLLPEGRNLAVHLERELGPGARVTLFDDWSAAQEG